MDVRSLLVANVQSPELVQPGEGPWSGKGLEQYLDCKRQRKHTVDELTG